MLCLRLALLDGGRGNHRDSQHNMRSNFVIKSYNMCHIDLHVLYSNLIELDKRDSVSRGSGSQNESSDWKRNGTISQIFLVPYSSVPESTVTFSESKIRQYYHQSPKLAFHGGGTNKVRILDEEPLRPIGQTVCPADQPSQIISNSRRGKNVEESM